MKKSLFMRALVAAEDFAPLMIQAVTHKFPPPRNPRRFVRSKRRAKKLATV
jgi:hypothetical protein